MKRYLLLLLALAGLTHAGQFFSGDTANAVTGASLPQYSTGGKIGNIYVSGPIAGTWSATVHVYRLQADNGLRLIATFTLTQAGPNTDGTGTRVYDALDLNLPAGYYFADVTGKTGTVPATGIAAEMF
jgi:hypothetical protein